MPINGLIINLKIYKKYFKLWKLQIFDLLSFVFYIMEIEFQLFTYVYENYIGQFYKEFDSKLKLIINEVPIFQWNTLVYSLFFFSGKNFIFYPIFHKQIFHKQIQYAYMYVCIAQHALLFLGIIWMHE